jgi:hypothetical protein
VDKFVENSGGDDADNLPRPWAVCKHAPGMFQTDRFASRPVKRGDKINFKELKISTLQPIFRKYIKQICATT